MIKHRVFIVLFLGLSGAVALRADTSQKDPPEVSSVMANFISEEASVAQALVLGRGVLDGMTVRSEVYLWTLSQLRLASVYGNMEARVLLVDLLMQGANGESPDYAGARRLAIEGQVQGSIPCALRAGLMLRHGHGGDADLPFARDLLELAMQAGQAGAAYELGSLYASGDLGQVDLQAAIRCYQLGADANDVACCEALGRLFESGEGGMQNYEAAFIVYEKAGRKGSAFSQNKVGWMLRNGFGIEVDNEEAVVWFQQALDRGYPMAGVNLAYHFMKGLGVPRNRERAYELLETFLMSSSDAWAEGLFTELFYAPAATRKAYEGRFLERIVSEGFLELEGALPEMAYWGLMRLYTPEARKLKAELIARMEKQARVQSSEVLAWHYYLGDATAWDRDKALAYAAQIADPERSRLMTHTIECVLNPDADERARALDGIIEMCRKGSARARHQLGRMYEYGEGVTPDIELAKRLQGGGSFPSPDERRDSQTMLQADLADEWTQKEIYRLIGTTNNQEARVFERIPPVYPPCLLEFDITGVVLVQLTVASDGRVKELTVLNSSHPLFTKSVFNTVPRWRYVPKISSGSPVESVFEEVITFSAQEIDSKRIGVRYR